MQDRYVGDVGDFAKYSLLNCLSEGQRLGVAWYLYPDEGHNADGMHIRYLDDPAVWRARDPSIYYSLKGIVSSGERSVRDVELSGCLNARTFAGEPLSCEESSYRARQDWREAWFHRVLGRLENCNIVFADPDNGLCRDEDFRPGTREMWKRIPCSEVAKLADGRTAVIYHHNTRRKGGHLEEIKDWKEAIGASFAVRVRHFSVRTFFVINPMEGALARAKDWCKRFSDKVELIK